MNLFAGGPTGVERHFLAGENYKELEVFETPTCPGTGTEMLFRHK